jgi:transketolase
LPSAPPPQRIAPCETGKLVLAYGDELLQIARTRPEIVVLDADLLSDCGIEAFKAEMPERFIECGIAEQHMVSAAGGLALNGILPVVHSFACFLSARANEHIYNNATERTKIIYTATLAGVVPGGPGHSHQSVRDISAIGSVPGLTAIEPCSEREARLAIRWAVESNAESTYLRFVNVPLDLPYAVPTTYTLEIGRGVILRDGSDVALIGYGPLLLTNAWHAADLLAAQGVSAAVINFPWLNRVDDEWVRDAFSGFPAVVSRQPLRHAWPGRNARRGGRANRASRRGAFPWIDRDPRVRIERGSAGASWPRCRRHCQDRPFVYPSQVFHWLNDNEVPSVGAATFDKRSPIDDRVVATVARGNAADVAGQSAAAGPHRHGAACRRHG